MYPFWFKKPKHSHLSMNISSVFLYIAISIVFLVTLITIAMSSVIGAVVGDLAAGTLSGEHLVPPSESEGVLPAQR